MAVTKGRVVSAALKIGDQVRHARRTDVGVIRNIEHPAYRWQSPRYDVRFPLNPTAPHWCVGEDLIVASPTAARPTLAVIERDPVVA